MYKKLIAIVLITALSVTAVFAVSPSSLVEPSADSGIGGMVMTETADEEMPQFEVLDENGNVEEVLDFELTNTYYVNADDASLNGIAPQALVTPDPNTNFYDLSNGLYWLYTQKSQTVYEMDKWFHANKEGLLHVSAHVIDAEGVLKFYRYNFNHTTHFWLVREYTLGAITGNPRARAYKGTIRNLDESGETYYTFLVTSTGNAFSAGLLKASWEEIDTPFSYQ